MNVQEVLEDYNSMVARISILNADIEKINNEISDIQGASLDGLPKGKGFVESSLEKQIIKKQEKIENKEKLIKELKQKLDIVDKLIKTLKKTNQDIIKMRYIDKMNIAEIAKQKGREYITIQRIIIKSIRKMQQQCNQDVHNIENV